MKRKLSFSLSAIFFSRVRRLTSMFFIGGISQGQKLFDWFTQTILCPRCKKYGRYQVFMTYTYFMFFFIPIFKWGRRYYVRTSCCQALYELGPEKGRLIEKRQDCTIEPEDLTLCQGQARQLRRCPRCGSTTQESFSFCPQCGGPME